MKWGWCAKAIDANHLDPACTCLQDRGFDSRIQHAVSCDGPVVIQRQHTKLHDCLLVPAQILRTQQQRTIFPALNLGCFCNNAFRELIAAKPNPEAYWLDSKVFFIAVSDFWRCETDRPTAAFRTIDPLAPVRPACSEPRTMIR